MKPLNIKLNIEKDKFKEKLGVKDGYTPVKGKDYFDGKDGLDGEDAIVDYKLIVDLVSKKFPKIKTKEKTIEEIAQELVGKLSYDDLKDLPNLNRLSARDYDFLELKDVPKSYKGQAGKFAKVNASEDGLEFGFGDGTGDMHSSVYDPNGYNTDVFDYYSGYNQPDLSVYLNRDQTTPQTTVGTFIFPKVVATTDLTSPLLIGGSEVTSVLQLKGTTGNGTLTSPAIQALVGNNGATVALTILNNGNVGIGTVGPAADLHIGSGSLGYVTRTRMIIQPPNHTGGPWKIDARDDSSKAYLDIHYGSGVGTTMNSDGNVGIGTTNPQVKLDIQGISTSSTNSFVIRDSAGIQKFSIANNGNTIIGPITGTNINFQSSGTEALDLNYNSNSRFMISTNAQTSFGASYVSMNGDGGMRLGQAGRYSYIVGGPNLLLQPVSGNVGIGTTGPVGKLDVQGTTAMDLPTYSAEFLLSTDWTSVDWTGGFTTGWTHTTGNTTALTQSKVAVSATKYQIAYTVTGRTAGSFTIGFGGQTSSAITATGAWGPTTSSTASLTITPTTDFNGTIVISIKSLTAVSTPLVNLKSSDGTARIEMRANTALGNTFIGVGAGRYNTTGSNNTANGMYSLYSNTTGSINTANGVNSLFSNTTGNYNTANGVNSLFSNTTGSINTANGVNSLFSNTTGSINTANGYQSLYSNTTGNNNTANGYQSLYSNTTGYYNTAYGNNSLYSNTTGSSNTANGYQSLYSNTTGNYNTANGYQSLYSNTTGYYNTAYGNNSGRFIADGTTANTTSDFSVYLGNDTKAGADNNQNEIVIGYGAIGAGSNTVRLGNASITGTYFNGNLAKIIGMDRHTTANTAGNGLTLKAGGATLLATDKSGGALILQGGLSTGTGESGVTIQGCVAGSSGTTDGTQTTKIQVLGDKIGFHGVTPIARAVLATGASATVDDVITALQNLGLVKQS